MRRSVRLLLLYITLSIVAVLYKLTGRRFLDLNPDSRLESYYQALSASSNHADEY